MPEFATNLLPKLPNLFGDVVAVTDPRVLNAENIAFSYNSWHPTPFNLAKMVSFPTQNDTVTGLTCAGFPVTSWRGFRGGFRGLQGFRVVKLLTPVQDECENVAPRF